ncbi:MAG: DUF58 domain-containing protein [Acidobacteria bacterium]|nr:DUF58 domain-containing protein [Acidobacteriota bacterium]
MSVLSRGIRHPFFWSLVFSAFALLFIELGLSFYRHGVRGMGILFSLLGIGLLVLEIVLFLPSLVRNAIQHTSFTLLFRITTPGIFYIIMIFLIALAAINTGNNLLYLLLSFLISAIIVSGIVSRWSLNRLSVGVDYQDAIFAGEYTSYRLKLENRKRWASSFSMGIEGFLVNATWLAVFEPEALAGGKRLGEKRLREMRIPYLRTSAYFPVIPAKASDVQVFPVRFSHRGLYRITEIEVFTSFPFGFFRKGRRIHTQGELIVYPAPIGESEVQACLEAQWETTPLLRKGLGTELFTLRNYIPGEDSRYIHWKASARSSGYIMKEFATEVMPSFVFLVDETVPGEPPASWDVFERAVSFFTTLVLELHQSGKIVHMLFSHTAARADIRRQDIPALLQTLAMSYPRYAEKDFLHHPLNRKTFIDDWLLPEFGGCVTLCSFYPPEHFPSLSPYLDNYLDLNTL